MLSNCSLPQLSLFFARSLSAFLSSLLRLSNRSKSPNPNSTLSLCCLVFFAGSVTTFSLSAMRTYGRRGLGLGLCFFGGRRFWLLPSGPEEWRSDVVCVGEPSNGEGWRGGMVAAADWVELPA